LMSSIRDLIKADFAASFKPSVDLHAITYFFNLQEETRKRNNMLEEATVESQTKKHPLTNTMDIYVQ